MTGQAEVDHVLAITRIEFGAFRSWQQIVHPTFVRRAITAFGTSQRIGGIAIHCGITIRAAKLHLKFGWVESNGGRSTRLAANSSKSAAQQSRGAPLGHRGALDNPLTPPAL